MRKFVMAAFLSALAGLILAVASPFVYDTNVQIVEPQVLASQTPQATVSKNLQMINDVRLQNGVSALIDDANIENAVKYRASDMVLNQYYSHIDRNGNDFVSLLANKNIYSCENLQLQTSNSLEKAINAWMNSASHKKCLLSSNLNKGSLHLEKFTSGDSDTYVIVFIGSN